MRHGLPALLLLVWPGWTAAQELPPALRSVAKTVETLGCDGVSPISLMNVGPRGPDVDSITRVRTLARAREQVTQHLAANPNDAAAWVLSARLGYVAGGCGAWASSVQDTSFTWIIPPLDVGPLLADLDRALALRPGYAEAHYWKAILYHIVQPVPGELAETKQDLDQTIRHAREAALLDSNTSAYRLFWGTALVEAGRMKEAVVVLQDLDGGRNQLYAILRDFEALPIPPGAVEVATSRAEMLALPLWANQVVFGAAMMSSYIGQSPERDLTHTIPLGRLRAWVSPFSVAGLQTFYGNVWPGFRFLDSAQVDSGEVGGYAIKVHHLRVDAAWNVRPAETEPGILRGITAGLDGLVIMVAEPSRVSDSARIHRPELNPNGAQSVLVGLNYRGSPPPDPPHVAALKADLRKLVMAQEELYGTTGRYGTRIGPKDVNVRLQEGHKVSIQRTKDGWTARIAHEATKTVCSIFVGEKPLAPATQEGVPACR